VVGSQRGHPRPDTLFVGQGTDIAYVDFSHLKGQAIKVSSDRTAVTVTLPKAQLEPAVLNVQQSYVYAQQQGVANRIGNFFSDNPNSQQQVYVAAQQKIQNAAGQNAAGQSAPLSEAQKNTQSMLRSLGVPAGDSELQLGSPGSFPAPSSSTGSLRCVSLRCVPLRCVSSPWGSLSCGAEPGSAAGTPSG
jgi:hypothetical protein